MTQGSSVMTSFLTLIWRIWCRCICHQKPPKVFMSLPSSSSLSSSSTAWIFSRGYFEFVTYGAAAYAIAGYWNAAGHHCDQSSSQSLSSISFSSLPSFFLIVMIVNLAHLSHCHSSSWYSTDFFFYPTSFANLDITIDIYSQDKPKLSEQSLPHQYYFTTIIIIVTHHHDCSFGPS